jgi:hypothetical protein
MEYSALTQPPSTFWNFIQRGTFSSTVAAQITRVLPKETSTDPEACGATLGIKEIGRRSGIARPSGRSIRGISFLRASRQVDLIQGGENLVTLINSPDDDLLVKIPL